MQQQVTYILAHLILMTTLRKALLLSPFYGGFIILIL